MIIFFLLNHLDLQEKNQDVRLRNNLKSGSKPASVAGSTQSINDCPKIAPDTVSEKKEIKEPSFKDSMKIILYYLFADLKKKQRSFRIGLITVMLVTACITIFTSGLVISPLIFMKLAENDVGEADVVLTPAVGSNKTVLNPPNAAMYCSYA